MLLRVPSMLWLMSTTLIWAVAGSCGGCVPGPGWIWFCGWRLRSDPCLCTLGWSWRRVARFLVTRVWIGLLVEVLVMWMLAMLLFLVVVVVVELFGLTGFRAGASFIGEVRATSAKSVSWCRPPVLTVASVLWALAGRVRVVTRRWATVVVPHGIWNQFVRIGAVWVFSRTTKRCFLLSAGQFGMLTRLLLWGFSGFFWWELRLNWVRCGGWGRCFCRSFIIINTQAGEIRWTYNAFCNLI